MFRRVFNRLLPSTASSFPPPTASSPRRRRHPPVSLPSQSSPHLPNPPPKQECFEIFFANITVWGPQAHGFLSTQGSQVQAIAEHHLGPKDLTALKAKLGKEGKALYANPAVPTHLSATGTSAGVGIIACSHLSISPIPADTISTVLDVDEPSAARWIAVKLHLRNVDVLLVVAYLHTTLGLGQQNMRILEQIHTAIKLFGLPTIVVGDWQVTPQQLADSRWPQRCGLVPALPFGCNATCRLGKGNATYIDYFLMSASLFPVAVVHPQYCVPWGPHIGLKLVLSSQLKSYLAPTLLTPKSLPFSSDFATLDQCDDKWTSACAIANDYITRRAPTTRIIGMTEDNLRMLSPEQQANSVEYAYAVTCAEAYICLCSEVPSAQVEHYLGRGHMPRVALKPLLARNAKRSHYSCWKCDTWATLVQVLSWLTRDGNSPVNIARLHAQLQTLVPTLSMSWVRAKGPNAPVNAWVKWIGAMTVTKVQACDPEYTVDRIRTWIERASSLRSYWVKVRVRTIRNGFLSWLTQAMKGSSAQAHAHVKAIEMSSCPGLHTIQNIYSGWQTLWEGLASVIPPNAPPHHVVPAWTSWKAQANSAITHTVNAQNKLDTLTTEQRIHLPNCSFDLQQLRTATTAYPKKKKAGIDSTPPAFFHVLPDHVLNNFSTLLTKIHNTLRWPIQLMINLTSLLPKPTQGTRPIAKTPVLYRLWCVVRSYTIKEWSTNHTPPWDTATPGNSAEISAGVRQWANEVAAAAGISAAGLYLDIEKFFDTIDIGDVVTAALEHGYPLADLHLALAVHMAPRILQLVSTASSLIRPLRGILQGCMHSRQFAKLVLWKPMQKVYSELSVAPLPPDCARLNCETYVDDVTLTALGKRRMVINALLAAGISFNASVRLLNLVVSAKSLVIGSDLVMARLVSSILKREANLAVRPTQKGRDLGVMSNTTGRRCTSLQHSRLNKANARLKRIASMSKSVKSARKLINTNALPQAMWGQGTLALAPTTLSKLRTSTAAAVAIGGHGRCRTTAIAIGIGHFKDPGVQAPVAQVKLWLNVWEKNSLLRGLTTRHWAAIKANIFTATVEPTIQWSRVVSPVSGFIATMYGLGWQLPTPFKWIAPNKQEWLTDLNGPKKPILELIRDQASSHLWTDAAKHYLGKGLEKGVDWPPTIALHKHLQKKLLPDNGDPEFIPFDLDDDSATDWPSDAITWLELFLTGGYWPAARAAEVHLHVQPKCSRCNYHTEDAYHLIWSCPANKLIKHHAVQSSQSLLTQARDGVAAHPCFWLRGLVPSGLVVVNTPCPADCNLLTIGCDFQPHAWPDGLYYTDCSGGEHSSFPTLRRCGIGIAKLTPNVRIALQQPIEGAELSDVLQFGAFGALPGTRQSAPRGELYSILVLATHVAAGVVHVYTDSQLNVDLYTAGPEKCKATSNGDLWAELFDVLATKDLDLHIHWIKGHANTDVAQLYGVTSVDLLGNYLADALARRGADDVAVLSDDVFNVKWHYSIAYKIQARAAVILSHVGHRRTAPLERAKPLPKLTTTAFRVQSQHRTVSMGKHLHCVQCNCTSPLGRPSIVQWLATPCQPDIALLSSLKAGQARPARCPAGKHLSLGHQRIHETHDMFVYKGLSFCKSCGYYGIKRALKLVDPCGESFTSDHAGQLRRRQAAREVANLLKGVLPHGVDAWPSDVERVGHVQTQLVTTHALG